MTFTLTVS